MKALSILIVTGLAVSNIASAALNIKTGVYKNDQKECTVTVEYGPIITSRNGIQIWYSDVLLDTGKKNSEIQLHEASTFVDLEFASELWPESVEAQFKSSDDTTIRLTSNGEDVAILARFSNKYLFERNNELALENFIIEATTTRTMLIDDEPEKRSLPYAGRACYGMKWVSDKKE